MKPSLDQLAAQAGTRSEAQARAQHAAGGADDYQARDRWLGGLVSDGKAPPEACPACHGGDHACPNCHPITSTAERMQ